MYRIWLIPISFGFLDKLVLWTGDRRADMKGRSQWTPERSTGTVFARGSPALDMPEPQDHASARPCLVFALANECCPAPQSYRARPVIGRVVEGCVCCGGGEGSTGSSPSSARLSHVRLSPWFPKSALASVDSSSALADPGRCPWRRWKDYCGSLSWAELWEYHYCGLAVGHSPWDHHHHHLRRSLPFSSSSISSLEDRLEHLTVQLAVSACQRFGGECCYRCGLMGQHDCCCYCSSSQVEALSGSGSDCGSGCGSGCAAPFPDLRREG
jgi:hypothetical protein